MAKSPDAFRTISEVADWLGIQAHVLRFWESKFTQVKPIKRAGGRRYYRPADMLLLGGIKKLLHDDGLTIKGVQKILREEGMNHVAEMSRPLDELTISQFVENEKPGPSKPATAVQPPDKEKGVVLSFEGSTPSEPDDTAPQEVDTKDETAREASDKAQPDAAEPAPEKAAELEPEEAISAEPASKEVDEPAPVAELPAFLQRPLADQDDRNEEPEVPDDPTPQETTPAPTPEPAAQAARKPRIVDLPAFTAENEFTAAPAALTSALRARRIAPENADKATTLLRQLTALRDLMSAHRSNATPPRSQD